MTYRVEAKGVDGCIHIGTWGRCLPVHDVYEFATADEAMAGAQRVADSTDYGVRVIAPDGTVTRICPQRPTQMNGPPGKITPRFEWDD